jgi:glycosyltransferase involved in cell wall biosynthesis
MKKLNLLVISTRSYPDTGGAANQVYLQSKFLSQFNVNVTLLTCKPSNDSKKRKVIDDSFQIITLPFEAPGLKTNKFKVILFFLKFMTIGLIKTIIVKKKYKIDLIHAHSPPPSGFLAFLVSKIFNLRYYYTLHGLDIPYILKLDLSISVINSEKTFVISKEMELNLNKIYNIYNTAFLPNGIDVSNYYHVKNETQKRNLIKRLHLENQLNYDDFIISYVGYMIFKQKVEGMIDFLKGFNDFLLSIEDKSHYKLLFIGNGKYSYLLVQAIKNLGLTENVFFLGERTDIKHILAISDLFGLTSHQEGFPIALLEAMASKVPCVASKVGEIENIVDATGFLVPPGDPQQIAKAISCYSNLSDFEKKDYKNKAQKYIKNKFDIRITVKKLMNQILH